MTPPDTVLFEQWTRTRDADVFAEIVSRHSSMVYATSQRVLGNSAEAEDVVQECFMELAQRRAPVTRSLGGLLHKMATRRALDRVKSESRRRKREARFVAERPAAREASWRDVQHHIDAAIAALPEKYRAPMVLRFLEGQTHEAIAETLDVPRSTVQHRIGKGLERVRHALKRRGVLVGAAALAALLDSHAAHAAPVSLKASLGRLAIAQSMRPPLAAAGAGAITLKQAAVGTVAFAVISCAVFVAGGAPGLKSNLEAWGWMGAQQAQPSKEVGALLGLVVDGQDRPVSGATVALMSFGAPGTQQTTSDVSGRFQFDGVLVNKGYALTALHPTDRTLTAGQFVVTKRGAAPKLLKVRFERPKAPQPAQP